MKYPIDPHLPHKDTDKELLHTLKDVPVNPVFIMGLHRSGTTFLYDSIARCFPMAELSLYSLFYYDGLLRNHKDGKEDASRNLLNKAFRGLNITDRKIDQVQVDDRMVEEYGWLLRNKSYHMSIHKTNKAYFAEICKKLLSVNPSANSVLLKNPWDTGNAEQIKRWFPNAKFIYITREPIAIVNSQINATKTLITGDQPFQTMLVDQFKMPGGKHARATCYGVWAMVRKLRNLVPDQIIFNTLRPFVTYAVKHDLAGYYNDIESLPDDSVYNLTYDGFNSNPVEKLLEIQEFLNLPFTQSPDVISPNPRKTFNTTLLKHEAKLMSQLEEKLGHSAIV